MMKMLNERAVLALCHEGLLRKLATDANYSESVPKNLLDFE